MAKYAYPSVFSLLSVWGDLRRCAEERWFCRGHGGDRPRRPAGLRPQGVPRRPGLQSAGRQQLLVQHPSLLQVTPLCCLRAGRGSPFSIDAEATLECVSVNW